MIADRIGKSPKQAQIMDNATGNKHISKPGKGGRGGNTFASKNDLDRMVEEYAEIQEYEKNIKKMR